MLVMSGSSLQWSSLDARNPLAVVASGKNMWMTTNRTSNK